MGIYTGTDLNGLPKTAGAYALVNYNPRTYIKKETMVYIGHAGGGTNTIKKRVNQHLVELTGTWTNGKHPAYIDIDQIDKVYAWSTDELLSDAGGKNPKVVAEAIEIIAKNELKPVMINDSKAPAHEALELSEKPDFLAAAIKHISDRQIEVKLPSRANILERIEKLELMQKNIETQLEELIGKFSNN